MFSIVIVNFKTAILTKDCLESLHREQDRAFGFRVELVDNASSDGSVEQLKQYLYETGVETWVNLIAAPRNGGFAYGNNVGILAGLVRNPESKYILLLNPDTVVHEGAVQELVDFLETHPGAHIAGSRLEDPDGTSQHAARRFHGILNELDSTARFGPLSRMLRRWCIVQPESDTPHECDWLPGASLMIRREVFEKIGLLDEGFFMYFEEVDFCKRAKDAGFKVGYVPQSRVIHLVGQASGVTSSGTTVRKRRPTYWFDSRARYFLRHHGRLGLLAANVAWILGQSIHHTVRMFRGLPSSNSPHLVRDFIRHMCRPSTWKLPSPPQYSAINSRPLQESAVE